MEKHVLITGGAGFVGSHLADQLLARRYRVRVLDVLSPQVHGRADSRPGYLNPGVELIVGDIRNRETVGRALKGIDVVCHLAAAVGVGQSMYEVSHYTSVNNLGTAVLLEALLERRIEKLLVASSMSVYGEGLYCNVEGEVVIPRARPLEQLRFGAWELRDDSDRPLEPVPTPESKTPDLASVYALSKYDQERLCLLIGGAYGISTVALRFFNVYGPRQALSNPYTGVMTIFAARCLNNRPPLIFEDGLQRRDFVNVRDVAQACILAIETLEADGQVFNVGSGQSYSILEVARELIHLLKPNLEPQVTGKYRIGDIRHCFADMTRAHRLLGYQPQVSLREGLEELAVWLEGKTALDQVETASLQLAERGLTI